jgi:hypothetical protein
MDTWNGTYAYTGTGLWPTLNNGALVTNNITDGYINIVVKDASGTTLNALWNANTATPTVMNGAAVSIKTNYVNAQPFTWGLSNRATAIAWMTDALDTNGQYAYPAGAYTFYAESKLNSMKDNYKNAGADYTGKTVSSTYTITLTSDTVKIEANKDTVIRSKPFSVTITGKPATSYVVWVKGTSSMDGTYDNQPPMINTNQEGVTMDTAAGDLPTNYFGTHYVTGSYLPQNAIYPTGIVNGGFYAPHATETRSTNGDVSNNDNTLNGTRCYANVSLSNSGTRTVEFVTTNWTKVQRYTIRVERNYTSGGQFVYKSDEVNVKVEKGAVTIVAAGDQNYYLGEEIKFSGTNTETYKTYLFLVGPNLPATGASIKSTDPRLVADKVVTGSETKFQVADVQGDNTWSWKWGTANIALDAGTYTIYAVSQPKDKDSLANAAYGTVSIIIKKPFVSATASQSTVAKGDKLFITGTAEGNPSKGHHRRQMLGWHGGRMPVAQHSPQYSRCDSRPIRFLKT